MIYVLQTNTAELQIRNTMYVLQTNTDKSQLRNTLTYPANKYRGITTQKYTDNKPCKQKQTNQN